MTAVSTFEGWAKPKSRAHEEANLRRHPHASCTTNAGDDEYHTVHGLHARGHASIVEDPEVVHLVEPPHRFRVPRACPRNRLGPFDSKVHQGIRGDPLRGSEANDLGPSPTQDPTQDKESS